MATTSNSFLNIDYEITLNNHTFQQVSEAHSHEEYEFLLCLSNGGSFYIGDSKLPLMRQMLFLIPPKVMHYCVVDILSYQRFIIHIPVSTMKTLSTPQTDFIKLFDEGERCITLPEEQFTQLQEKLTALLNPGPIFGFDISQTIKFLDVFLDMARLFQYTSVNQVQFIPNKSYKKMEPIMEYIQCHYMDDISLDSLCREFSMSKSSLCHQFKEQTGFSVNQYLINCRIRSACTLLKRGKSIQEASEEVGFRNYSYFISCFREIIGMTPKKYIQSFQDNYLKTVS